MPTATDAPGAGSAGPATVRRSGAASRRSPRPRPAVGRTNDSRASPPYWGRSVPERSVLAGGSVRRCPMRVHLRSFRSGSVQTWRFAGAPQVDCPGPLLLPSAPPQSILVAPTPRTKSRRWSALARRVFFRTRSSLSRPEPVVISGTAPWTRGRTWSTGSATRSTGAVPSARRDDRDRTGLHRISRGQTTPERTKGKGTRTPQEGPATAGGGRSAGQRRKQGAG